MMIFFFLPSDIRKRLHKVSLFWKSKWYLPLQRLQRPKAINLALWSLKQLVCWQWQYLKLENTYSCLNRGTEFSRIIMNMHNSHETGKITTVLCFRTQQICTLWGLHVTVCSNSLWWLKAIWIKKHSVLWPSLHIVHPALKMEHGKDTLQSPMIH